MWNIFKKKYRVCADDCINRITAAILQEEKLTGNYSMDLWTWVESKGVKREYSWKDHKNYLVFDSEQDYTWFLLKL